MIDFLYNNMEHKLFIILYSILIIYGFYLVLKEKIISILNTSLFMITDYFGNKNKFYDNLIVNSLLITNKQH